MTTETLASPVRCKAEIAPRVVCGRLVAIRKPNGWEVVCKCGERIVLVS